LIGISSGDYKEVWLAELVSSKASASAASQLTARFQQVRATTLRLIAPLSEEDAMVQSMTDTSPAKWHLAHTTWFFETFILAGRSGYRVFDPAYRLLFNSYYKALGSHPLRQNRNLFSRPSFSNVLSYHRRVNDAVERLLQQDPEPQALELIDLGTHHEQQHQELILTDILHAFWSQPLRPAYASAAPQQRSSTAPPLRWISHPGGVVEIGAGDDIFCFDNERPRHRVLIAPYRLASRLTTNAEYLEFINDGAYSRPELWLSDGWDIVCREGWQAPLYWERAGNEWSEFTLHGMNPLNPAAPVCHVSYFEADAFARWAGARLPLESEWESAAEGRAITGNLLDSEVLDVTPAHDDNTGQEMQMFGDVWEWTASAYLAYPGFRPAAGAIGEYNGKFMCNQFVLRGGSCATPASHIRASYRNFFPPHARWQFMGIRLANDGS
jgi:ergothioneine biosynthesis protein EgtB